MPIIVIVPEEFNKLHLFKFALLFDVDRRLECIERWLRPIVDRELFSNSNVLSYLEDVSDYYLRLFYLYGVDLYAEPHADELTVAVLKLPPALLE